MSSCMTTVDQRRAEAPGGRSPGDPIPPLPLPGIPACPWVPSPPRNYVSSPRVRQKKRRNGVPDTACRAYNDSRMWKQTADPKDHVPTFRVRRSTLERITNLAIAYDLSPGMYMAEVVENRFGTERMGECEHPSDRRRGVDDGSVCLSCGTRWTIEERAAVG